MRNYEELAVKVANDINNDHLRASASSKVVKNFRNVRLANKTQRGANRFLSVFLLATTLVAGGYGVNQNLQLNKAKQNLFQMSQQLEQVIVQSEQNYNRLLKEASRAYFDRHTIRYLGDEKFYARIVVHEILGRSATKEEQAIILEEVLNTIVPESGLPLREQIPESPRYGYFDFGGRQNEN